MEKLPKRRILSLSLSQQGKESKRIHSRRNRSSTKSFDSLAKDNDSGNPEVKETRNLNESKSKDASSFSFENFPLACLPTCEVASQNLKINSSVESPHDGKSRSPVKVSTKDLNLVDKSESSLSQKASILISQDIKENEFSSDQNIKAPSKHDTEAKRNKFSGSEHYSTCSKSTVLEEIVQKPNEEEVQESMNVGKEEKLQSSVDQKSFQSVFALSEDQDVIQCPLCFKNFDQKCNKSAHLKGCAMKHGMTTRQLLDALDLQKRQFAERKALGLPFVSGGRGKPKLRKDSHTHQKTKMDSGLQLALALSLSMHDQEKAKENVQGDVPSLESFGFVSKPVLESVHPNQLILSKGKGKTCSKKTPLLTRTAEERQQIMTEKVAMVLMEETDLTSVGSPSPVKVASELLKEYHNKGESWWSKSQVPPTEGDRTSYYVKELRGLVSPSKVQTGSKVMHISQVAGRVPTPEKERNTPVEKCQDEGHLSSPKLIDIDSDSGSSKTSSSVNINPDSSDRVSKIEVELRAKLFSDWAGMVNNSSMSDVIIYPKEGRDIPSHKLLLIVRCPAVFHDIIKQHDPITGNEVEVILWSKIPHASALAFLEYLYCGSVKSIPALGEDLSSIKWLASHYKVSDLLKYLKAITTTNRVSPSQAAIIAACDLGDPVTSKVNILSRQDSDTAICAKNHDESRKMDDGIQLEHSDVNIDSNRVSEDLLQSPQHSEADSIYSHPTLTDLGSQRSLSPDLFEDDADVNYEKTEQEMHHPHLLFPLTKDNPSTASTESLQRPPSRQLSECSESTVILKKNSHPPSPSVSIGGLNSDCSVQISPTSVDSKRKLSVDSDEGDCLSSKRICSQDSTPQRNSPKNDSVVLYDLTQDSSPGSCTQNHSRRSSISRTSCDSVVITSDNENRDSGERSKGKTLVENVNEERINEIPLDALPTATSVDSFQKGGISPISNHLQITDSSLSNTIEKEFVPEERIMNCSNDPYVSPVWDGFEDLNYGEPCLSAVDTGVKTTDIPEILHCTPTNSFSSSNNNSTLNVSKAQKGKSKEERITSGGLDSGKKIGSPINPRDTQANVSCSLGALLDDSFNKLLTDSILQTAEKDCIADKVTPKPSKKTPVRRLPREESFTPIADYSAMKTPDLKKELKKFGLKPSLGKRKGKIMLRHIYNELHPWVPVTDAKSSENGIALSQPVPSKDSMFTSLSQPSTSSTSRKRICASGEDKKELSDADSADSEDGGLNESSGSSDNYHEGSFLEDVENEFESLSQVASQSVERNLWVEIQQLISSDPQVHQKVLEYEPIWIEKLHTDLRVKGIKVKMADLMGILDEKCITFRTVSSGPRVKKKKSNKCVQKQTATLNMDNEVDLSD